MSSTWRGFWGVIVFSLGWGGSRSRSVGFFRLYLLG